MLKPPATQDFQTTISCPTLTNHGTKAAMNQLLADQWENREGRKIRGGGGSNEEDEGEKRGQRKEMVGVK